MPNTVSFSKYLHEPEKIEDEFSMAPMSVLMMSVKNNT